MSGYQEHDLPEMGSQAPSRFQADSGITSFALMGLPSSPALRFSLSR